MILLSWFVLGWLAGISTLAIASIIFINCEGKSRDNGAFVIELIKQKGWEKSNEILTFEYSGKYLNIWRKLYREHIEKGENK